MSASRCTFAMDFPFLNRFRARTSPGLSFLSTSSTSPSFPSTPLRPTAWYGPRSRTVSAAMLLFEACFFMHRGQPRPLALEPYTKIPLFGAIFRRARGIAV